MAISVEIDTNDDLSGAGNYIEVAEVILTPDAAVAAPLFQWANGSYDRELSACKRFFEKSYRYATPMGDAGAAFDDVETVLANRLGSSATEFVAASFQVQKRIVPTVTFWTTGGTIDNWERSEDGGAYANVDITAGVVYDNERRILRLVGTALSAAVHSVNFIGAWAADAEI